MVISWAATYLFKCIRRPCCESVLLYSELIAWNMQWNLEEIWISIRWMPEGTSKSEEISIWSWCEGTSARFFTYLSNFDAEGYVLKVIGCWIFQSYFILTLNTLFSVFFIVLSPVEGMLKGEEPNRTLPGKSCHGTAGQGKTRFTGCPKKSHFSDLQLLSIDSDVFEGNNTIPHWNLAKNVTNRKSMNCKSSGNQ